jgi:hypothetical protein
MDNLSMAAGIGSQIGALELGDHLASHGDGVLESAGANELAGPPTGPRWTGACCGRMDDGVLEAAGMTTNLSPPPTHYPCAGRVTAPPFCR